MALNIETLNVCIRSFFSLMFLFLATKLIGKKQASELNLFDYVLSISIGNFAAEISLNTDYNFLNGIAAVSVFALTYVIISILSMKSIKLRKYITGTPTIIIKDGNFVYESFKKLRLDINDFLQTCRLNGYFDISVLKYAIMESNGSISFLPYESYTPVIYKDTNYSSDKQNLKVNIIIDGKIIHNNLASLNKNEDWLKSKIKGKKIKDILLATLDYDDNLTIYNK